MHPEPKRAPLLCWIYRTRFLLWRCDTSNSSRINVELKWPNEDLLCNTIFAARKTVPNSLCSLTIQVAISSKKFGPALKPCSHNVHKRISRKTFSARYICSTGFWNSELFKEERKEASDASQKWRIKRDCLPTYSVQFISIHDKRAFSTA